MIGPLGEENKKLAKLKTFPAEAFSPGSDVPPSLCGFMLALALFYNDLKDSIYTYSLLMEYRPEGKPQIRSDWGAYPLCRNPDAHHSLPYRVDSSTFRFNTKQQRAP